MNLQMLTHKRFQRQGKLFMSDYYISNQIYCTEEKQFIYIRGYR